MDIYKFIAPKGYTGKYSILSDFVGYHKQEEIKKATISFETNPRLQAQIDWQEDMTLISRRRKVFKINIFLMVMGYSLEKFIMVTTELSQETLFQCMINAFRFYVGIPR